MTIEHFLSFSKTHQALFHEVFTLQRRMRKRTLGIEEWHDLSKRRIELMAGRFVRLADLLILVSWGVRIVHSCAVAVAAPERVAVLPLWAVFKVAFVANVFCIFSYYYCCLNATLFSALRSALVRETVPELAQPQDC
jgi:hypothetical protein